MNNASFINVGENSVLNTTHPKVSEAEAAERITDGSAEQSLVSFVTQCQWHDIPPEIIHEAKRAILNMLATAIAGSGEAVVEHYLAVIQGGLGGEGVANCLGRSERLDILNAAFVNAMSANVFDIDDTHPTTIIHPTAPVLPALLALSQQRNVSGRELLLAFVLGAEIECRLGRSMSPEHYGRGWHITSTCGVLGAAVACGRLLNVDQQTLLWSLANAAVQAGGLVETLGTMSKSLSVGNAARNGLLAVLLAQQGVAGPRAPLLGQYGFLRVYGETPRVGWLLDELGQHWELATNTYKPYPVGVVLNPVIDACLQLYGKLAMDTVVAVSVTGNALLKARTDRPGIETGRQSQVSAQHAVAVVLARGQAGLEEFGDEAVAAMKIYAMDSMLQFEVDDSMRIEEASVAVTTNTGQMFCAHVTAASGSSLNPLTDVQLEQKLRTLVAARCCNCDVDALLQAVWNLEDLEDASRLASLAAAPLQGK